MKPKYFIKTGIFGLMMVLIGFSACNTTYSGVPEKYHEPLDSALADAGENRDQLEEALQQVPDSQKEAMAFLISYMPGRDLENLSAGFLVENVHYAYLARDKFPWTRDLPDSVFFNEVLPYASLNERRDNWRGDFFERFSKYVEDADNIREAIDSVNQNINDEVGVEYNTDREKSDQSPYESMEQGMATCTGLSVLLTDAFRAVGIPSRIAGAPSWHDDRGNHTWNEVLIDGKWYFTEYYPAGLNESWFVADAGRADADNPKYAIWASSFKPTGEHFPLIWDMSIKYVPGVNVTDRYVSLYEARQKEKVESGDLVPVKVAMYKDESSASGPDDRVAQNVDVFADDEQVGGGQTSGPRSDLNDVLTFYLEKDKTYSFRYTDEEGNKQVVKKKVGTEPVSLDLYMK
ncbi:MAG: transglutaminase-like domain-containing protein [Marinilabiliaceae bacterium]